MPLHQQQPKTTVTHPALVRQPSGAEDLSRKAWIAKLNKARYKWMVTLHRYKCSSKRSSSAPPTDKVRHLDALQNGLNNASPPSRRMVVLGADFCPDCASIVEVVLELMGDDLLVTEHRSGCPVCVGEQNHARVLRTLPAIATIPRQRDTSNNRHFRGLDENWRLWKDQVTSDRETARDFIILRGLDHAPSESFKCEQNQGGQSGTVNGAPGTAGSESRTRWSTHGRPDRALKHEDNRTAKAERIPPHPTWSATGSKCDSVPGLYLNEKQGQASDSDAVSNNPAGGDAEGEGSLQADGDWADEIRKRDELISTLKRQLVALGEQPIEEVVTLEVAKERLREAIDALMAGDTTAEAEQAMDKWDKYVTNHPDHIKEKAAEEQAWEAENETKNNQALRLMKTFVPSDIFHADLDGLRGGGLPPALAKRIFDRKVLWLVRAPEGMVSKTHVVELNSKFVANDLDVVESRALHACLPTTFENDFDGAKTGWRAGFRKRLKELLAKEASGQLKPAEVRRPVYEDLAEGPFDPEVAPLQQETTRSSAFDASEKPVVGGKLDASKIAVIGEGLAAKLKHKPGQLQVRTHLNEDTGGLADATTRSALNSPASKYRRQSYALSRGQPTASSMKSMMGELGDRLATRMLSQRRSSSFNDSIDLSNLLRGALDPVSTLPEAVEERRGTSSWKDDVDSDKSYISEAGTDHLAEPSFRALKLPEDTAAPPVGKNISIAETKNPGPGRDRAALRMKDTMAELASKAKARGEQSAKPPSQITSPKDGEMPTRSESDAKKPKLSSSASSPPSMKEIISELASQGKAREERSALPPSQTPAVALQDFALPQVSAPPPPPPPPTPPTPPTSPAMQQHNTAGASNTAKESPSHASKPVGMKEMMAELEAKAKARASHEVAKSHSSLALGPQEAEKLPVNIGHSMNSK